MGVYVVDDTTPVELLEIAEEGIIQVVSGSALIAADPDPSQGIKVTAADTASFIAPVAAVTAISATPGRTATIRTTGAPTPPPPPPAATGAIAGIPGSFTPVPNTPPADFAGMAGIVADPLTAWTVGQSVQPADVSDAYWDGAAWQVGTAPA